MNIEEIAAAAPQARPLAVPAWTLGCFRRRSITYAPGVEDARTRVVWLQSHGLTGDIRIPADRPDLSHRTGLADCSRDELVELAQAEGGVAASSFADGRMSWSNWSAFQPYDRWPEPGALRRVGACLIEFAPSGAYVEDWRAQGGAPGLLIGLRLLGESRNGGPLLVRDGGLVIAGEHAILVVGRRRPLPSDEPLPGQLRLAADVQTLVPLIFDAEAGYARRAPDGRFLVELSTNPFSEGDPLELDGFGAGPEPGLLSQELACGVRRLWRVDTLLPDCELPLATPAEESGAAWLRREAERLPGAPRLRTRRSGKSDPRRLET